MKKVIGLLVILLVIASVTMLKLNNAEAVDQKDKGILNDQEKIEDVFENTESNTSIEAEKVAPLSQKEYDDLKKSLPENAELVGEIEVLPGVVK